MKITVLTLFPEMYSDFLHTSIIGRAIERGLVEVECVQIRDFALDHYRHVDDRPFGGGKGQVMKCQPILDALNEVKTEGCHTVMMSPAGSTLTQQKARQLAKEDHLIILCGHYEGIDARVNDFMDEMISIGDYVLTGGEIASMVVMDSVIRLLRGAITEGSADDESYENGLLEYPQYTQPADYQGMKVPDVLLSGHHANIDAWRTEQSLLLTKEKRPDLFEKHEFTEYETKILKKLRKEGKI